MVITVASEVQIIDTHDRRPLALTPQTLPANALIQSFPKIVPSRSAAMMGQLYSTISNNIP